MKEATARIKINKLLEAAGWLFFPDGDQPANIRLEPSVAIKSTDLDALGADFEKTSKGFVDFLLLDEKGFPLIVLEAKAEDKNPLVGKEQARKYARSQNCRFVILSNGNLHYFWDLERGNPYITSPDYSSRHRFGSFLCELRAKGVFHGRSRHRAPFPPSQQAAEGGEVRVRRRINWNRKQRVRRRELARSRGDSAEDMASFQKVRPAHVGHARLRARPL